MIDLVLKRYRYWWIVVPVIAVCAVIAGGALSIWNVANTTECKTDVRRSILSPNGKMSLVVFGKECGATVGFNTQISIAPAGGTFSPEKSPAFYVTSGLHVVMAKWLGDSAVEIGHIPGGEKAFRSEQTVGEVKVFYR